MVLLDPSELLQALAPLLAEDGGIRSASLVPRVVCLMKRFSRKLVCRCIYCCIIKATSVEVLEEYLDEEGWTLLFNWTTEAKDNLPFLKILMEVFEMLPMNVDRLKANGTAKIIKNLSKHSDTDLAQRADALVTKWRSLIKNEEGSKDNVKSSKEKASHEKSKDDKERKRDRKKSDDEKKKDDKDRHRHKSSRSDKDRKDRKERRKDSKDKDSKSDKDRPSKKARTENSDPSSMDTDVVPPRPPTPPEVRKPKIERPKTVKEYGSKLRLTSFLEEDPTTTKIKKKVTKPSSALSKPTVPVSSLRSLTGPGGVRASLMNAHLNQTEQQVGNIKLIAPKASHLIMENEGFMNALTASSPVEKVAPPLKKKKKIDIKRGVEVKRRNSKDEETDETPMSIDSEGPSAVVSETKEPVKKEDPLKLTFYKDTLDEKEEEPPKRTLRSRTKKVVIEESDEEDDVQRNEDEASMESSSSLSQEPEEKPVVKTEETADNEEEGIPVILQTHSEKTSNPSGIKPILTIVTNRNRIKKTVRWKEEAELKSFRYFEHDPTERINVNNVNHMQQAIKCDGSMDIKMIEMRMERERLRAPNDRMEEQQAWRMPVIIEIPANKAPALAIHEAGKNSEMRDIEAARQATVLEVIYFNRRMIPDSPSEPDVDSRRGGDTAEAKLIPIDVEVFPPVNEEPQWPAENIPTALPSALTDLLANIHNPGQAQLPMQNPTIIPPEIPIIPQGPPNAYGQPMGGPPGDMKPHFMMNGMAPQGQPGPPGMSVMPPGIPGGPMMHDQEGGHWAPMGGPQPDHHMQPMPGPHGPPHPTMMQHLPPNPMIDERRRGRGTGRANIRGTPRTLCKFFKQGHCRFGVGCTFLHPGVNGPEPR